MTKAYLQYALHDGFIHNWLVLGPRVAPLDGGCTPSALLGTTADPVIEAEAVEPAAADDVKVAFDGFEGNRETEFDGGIERVGVSCDATPGCERYAVRGQQVPCLHLIHGCALVFRRSGSPAARLPHRGPSQFGAGSDDSIAG